MEGFLSKARCIVLVLTKINLILINNRENRTSFDIMDFFHVVLTQSEFFSSCMCKKVYYVQSFYEKEIWRIY